MLERMEMIIKEKINIIKKKTVLIIGLGGVGSYALETLIRAGFERLIIIDNDIIDITNLNRQLMTDRTNIGAYKTDIWEARINKINPLCEVIKITKFITKENIEELFSEQVDYVIDACDTLETKKELIKYCLNNKIKFISAMGMGNRLDATKIKITTLVKTEYDPLAKKLRRLIKEENIKGVIPVVASYELPIKQKEIGSISYVPATAGLMITNYIVNDILKEAKDE